MVLSYTFIGVITLHFLSIFIFDSFFKTFKIQLIENEKSNTMKNKIKGKIAVFTRESSGLEEATVRYLAAKNAKVVLGANPLLR